MKSIITAMWDGSFAPQECLLLCNKSATDACEKSEAIRKEIEKRIPVENRYLLEQYDKANLTVADKSAEEAFRRGVTVGIRMMMEAMKYDNV